MSIIQLPAIHELSQLYQNCAFKIKFRHTSIDALEIVSLISSNYASNVMKFDTLLPVLICSKTFKVMRSGLDAPQHVLALKKLSNLN